MVYLFAAIALLPAAFGLWAVGRTDLLRLVQGVGYARATVVRHELGTGGYAPIYRFQRGATVHEVRGQVAHLNPDPPLGTGVVLSFPRRRPDLARTPQTFQRVVLYGGLAAWVALFGDIAFGWF